MVLHFGGSLPGLENDMADYHAIRSFLIQEGHTIARDWLGKQRHEGLVNIFSENERSISRSDAIILDATYDTHGVGIQLAIALMHKRPTLLLIKDHADMAVAHPRLVNEKDRPLLRTAMHDNIDQAKVSISEFIKWVENNDKLARFNMELDRKLDNYLKLKGRVNHTSKTEEIRKLIENDFKQYYEGNK
jgi:hypothetical protein